MKPPEVIIQYTVHPIDTITANHYTSNRIPATVGAVAAVRHQESGQLYAKAVIGAFGSHHRLLGKHPMAIALPESAPCSEASILSYQPPVDECAEVYESISRDVRPAELDRPSIETAVRHLSLGLAALSLSYLEHGGYRGLSVPFQDELLIDRQVREAQLERIRQRKLVILSGY